MNNFVASIFYKTGLSIRNNLILKNYNFLKKTEEWSIEKLEEYQLKKLKDMTNHAYHHSSFYKELYDSFNFDINKIETLSDLSKIPTVTKKEILENVDKVQVKNLNEKMFYSETSGSTGTPLVFYRNKDWDAWHNASVFRGYSWYNVNPWDKNGYLWGYNIAPRNRLKIKLQDYLQNRTRIFTYDKKQMLDFINKLKTSVFLNGYSSMIYELAKLANEHNIELKNLKLIKGTSEKIHEAYQAEALQAFGRKIISEYGSAEGGIIAFECPHGKMHINMETVIVEEIDNEILLTNLVSKSFPIIRYKLGDYIKINKDYRCNCGMQHHIIMEINGRVGSVIYGHNKTYPSLTIYYVFKNLASANNIILNYHCVQNIKGTLIVYIEAYIGKKERSYLLKEFLKYFGDDLRIDIKDGSKYVNFAAKKKDFVSNV